MLADRRPYLLLGSEIIAFLRARRAARKRACGAGELYCFGCRDPRKPADGLVELRTVPPSRIALVAICSGCEGVMRRFVSNRNVAAVGAEFHVRLDEGTGG